MTEYDLTPRLPDQRPLIWPDFILDLQDRFLDLPLPQLYIVGGAVRDAFLHRPVKDLDLATAGDAIQAARRITNALKGDLFIMDEEREVARVFVETPDGPLTIDVARFRGPDLLTDLVERDFTINAMAVDLTGDLNLLIDPLRGQEDASTKVLRRCNPASIASDPIRALRAVRQSTQLTLRIHPETVPDLRAAAPRLLETSPERVRDELFQILRLDQPAAALRVADALGLLNVILPELRALHSLEQPVPHRLDAWTETLQIVEKMGVLLKAISPRRSDETAATFGMGMLTIQLDRYRAQLNEHIDEVHPNQRNQRALLIFAALLAGIGKAEQMSDYAARSAQMAALRADALHLSNAERRRLKVMIAAQRRIADQTEWPLIEQHRYWYRLGVSGVDALLLGLMAYLAQEHTYLDQLKWLKRVECTVDLLRVYYEEHNALVAPPPFLNGSELIEQFALTPGRVIGELLDALREAQVLGEVSSRAEALAFVEAQLRRN